jgi:predicted transport protein
MIVFKIEKEGTISPIDERPFKLEKDLQTLCEGNLEKIFALAFVKSQLTLHNFRIDTLAFDNQSKSFVIIEYKKDRNFSVVDQGYAYLSLMLNNKADFILEYNENCDESLKRGDVDWSQSKVIFVSPSFTSYQRESINFKDLPIELWEVKRYENETVHFSHLRPSGATETIQTISGKSETIERVSKEIKVYTEEDHLSGMPEGIKELYKEFREAILNINDNITIKPMKKYIGFIAKKNISDILIQKKALKIFINLRIGQLDDPKRLARDISNIGHWGNGDYELHVVDDENIEYIISLIKQSFKRNSQ